MKLMEIYQRLSESPGFKKKHGVSGWPEPQLTQILGWAKRYQIKAYHKMASTGTYYITLTSNNAPEEIKVRVADHDDVYATSDFSIDPINDERIKVKDWIETHGNKTNENWKIRLGKLKKKYAGMWVVTPDGEPWFPVSSADREDQIELIQMQGESGKLIKYRLN